MGENVSYKILPGLIRKLLLREVEVENPQVVGDTVRGHLPVSSMKITFEKEKTRVVFATGDWRDPIPMSEHTFPFEKPRAGDTMTLVFTDTESGPWIFKAPIKMETS